jgi:membrane protease YdiL (CAAX protease family)
VNSERKTTDGLVDSESPKAPEIRSDVIDSVGELPGDVSDPEMAEARAFHNVWETDAQSNEHPPVVGTSRESGRRARFGIGLPEAVLWTLGVLMIHLVGGIAAMIWIVASHVMEAAVPGDPQATQAAVMALLQDSVALQTMINANVLTLLIGEMGIFVVCAVAMSLLRIGWSPRQKLGLTAISAKQLLLILGMTVPLALVCGTLHQWTTAGWEIFAEQFPALQSMFEGADVNQQLKPIGEKAPLGLLLLVIALAPAIGEEIVFRGVIGRGLVARYGILPGIIFTSLLFASVHLHPAHVIALLPLAFLIHFVYLVTRSFWAPVLLHFANNALAAMLLKVSAQLEGTPLADNQGLPMWGFAVACVLVAMAVRSLWVCRVEYRLPGGSIWSPGYESFERPPTDVLAIATPRHGEPVLCGLALVSTFVFTCAFAASLAGALQDSAVLAK